MEFPGTRHFAAAIVPIVWITKERAVASSVCMYAGYASILHVNFSALMLLQNASTALHMH
jgi:hypothetical protein